mmetsp:Transcript_30117/g.55167  ORF Transcript_30117/g.55167 Transcript_30117/m.55167 type:complete len:119 (+) Transcript_30117:264-620(+)
MKIPGTTVPRPRIKAHCMPSERPEFKTPAFPALDAAAPALDAETPALDTAARLAMSPCLGAGAAVAATTNRRERCIVSPPVHVHNLRTRRDTRAPECTKGGVLCTTARSVFRVPQASA